jgi:thiamine pyrophosphokinase
LNAIIFSNGQIDHYDFVNNSDKCGDNIIICCDGGIRHAKALGIIPDYILGDMDSAPKEIIEYYKDLNVCFKVFPTKKDETDTEIGIEFAISLGATYIDIYGASGNRLDHTLANIHNLMIALKAGVVARMLDEHNCIQLIDKDIELIGMPGDIISLIPLSSVVHLVTTSGLEYPLYAEDLTIGASRGISNVMLSHFAKVTIDSGYLIVIKAID